MDRETDKVVITLNNSLNKTKAGAFANAQIQCDSSPGDYILTRYFNGQKTIEIQLKEKIDLNVYSVGVVDSFSLIHPPLPTQNFIRIFKKNLDL